MKCRYAKHDARTTAVFSCKFKYGLFRHTHTSFGAVRSHFISYRVLQFVCNKTVINRTKSNYTKQYHYSFILIADWFRRSRCLLPLWHRLALHLNSFSNHDFNSYIAALWAHGAHALPCIDQDAPLNFAFSDNDTRFQLCESNRITLKQIKQLFVSR